MAGEQYPVIGDQNNLMTAPGPGASVANTLQAILAQRRQQRQEELVNQISQQRANTEQQNVESEIQNRQDVAATNKAYREGLIADREDKANERQRDQDRLNSIAAYAQTQHPEDQVEDQMWRIIEHDPNRYEQLSQAILTRREQAAKAKKAGGEVYTFDNKGNLNDTGIWDESGAKYLHQGNEAQGAGSAQNNTVSDWVNYEPDLASDPSGQTLHEVHYAMTPSQYQQYGFSNPAFRTKGQGGPGSGHKGNEPQPKPTPPILDPADSGKLATLRGKAVETPGTFYGTNPAPPEAQAAYEQELQNVLGRARVTPDVRETARAILAHFGHTPFDIDQVVETQTSDSTPAEKQQLKNLLHIVLSR